ncbi:MAG: chorismate synthase [Oscillospiraceae bacterium]|jgi:chorismate synthase
MPSEFGRNIVTTLFGESHGTCVGAVVSGFPAGEEIDMAQLSRFMERRAPGRLPFSTSRKEPDVPEIVSGVADGRTNGFPLTVIIKNTNVRRGDYSAISSTPRPGHADYTAWVKYGPRADMSGGGHFSGRLTAPLCAAGGIALQMLSRRGIRIGAHLASVGSISDQRFPLEPEPELFEEIASRDMPVIEEEAGKKMLGEIESARADGDSVGGSVECAVTGVPAGIGGPAFDGIEGRLSQAVFGIPAVKGIEFGSGFEGSLWRGSRNNDQFYLKDGSVKTLTNNCGGILGGISDGMPIVFRAAFKPTPSISKKQMSVDLTTMSPAEIEIKGRHDPCVAVRAVPAVEAAAALVILDMLSEVSL